MERSPSLLRVRPSSSDFHTNVARSAPRANSQSRLPPRALQGCGRWIKSCVRATDPWTARPGCTRSRPSTKAAPSISGSSARRMQASGGPGLQLGRRPIFGTGPIAARRLRESGRAFIPRATSKIAGAFFATEARSRMVLRKLGCDAAFETGLIHASARSADLQGRRTRRPAVQARRAGCLQSGSAGSAYV